MFIFEEKLTIGLCRRNPEAIVVFGDNLIHRGKAGQAQIRSERNAFGVPTKRLPSMNKNAFFIGTDEEYQVVRKALIKLWEAHKSGKTVILPTAMIGSGLARLQSVPKIWNLVERFYSSAYNA